MLQHPHLCILWPCVRRDSGRVQITQLTFFFPMCPCPSSRGGTVLHSLLQSPTVPYSTYSPPQQSDRPPQQSDSVYRLLRPPSTASPPSARRLHHFLQFLPLSVHHQSPLIGHSFRSKQRPLLTSIFITNCAKLHCYIKARFYNQVLYKELIYIVLV